MNTASLAGQTLGQYRIIEKVGEGGMATVFKAFQPGLNRDVALKVLPPHFASQPGFTERFMREAQAIGNLHHPNILPVHDSGQDKGYSYIVMRYISNATTLVEEMKTTLSTERIIEVIGQIGDALDHAHKAGIIHRDVKPSNVLMDGKWALLSDFGLAKMVETSSDLTGSGVGIGTPAYMSPEQGMGREVDHRTDIYALGIILYEMLTGQVPHRAETPMATVLKRVNEPLPMPRSLNPNIPEAVERVLLKVFAPKPDDRDNSAEEMVQALKDGFGPAPADIAMNTVPSGMAMPKTATPPEEATDAPPKSAQSPPHVAPPKKGVSGLAITGFLFVGLLLVLILGGIGVLVFRQPKNNEPTIVEVEVTTPPENTPTTAPTPTPEPTQKLADTIKQPTATEEMVDPTVPPAPTATEEVVDPTATPVPPTPAAPEVPAEMTGQEVYELSLAEALKWQPDAVLSEISTTGLGPLDAEGKSTSWTLKYWSPSSKGTNSFFVMEGALTSTATDLPVPQAVVAIDVILDTKQLYDIGNEAGATVYTVQGYRPMASLTPYPLDKDRLTWYLNYAGGDFRVVYTVIIDATTGEVIQALDLQ